MGRRFSTGATLAAVLLVAAGSTSAAESPGAEAERAEAIRAEKKRVETRLAETRPTEPKAARWYGWETLMSDGFIIGLPLLFAPFCADSSARACDTLAVVAGLGPLGYFFAPPIIHLSHGRLNAGLYSFLSRTLLPLGGALVFGGLATAMSPNGCGGLKGDAYGDCQSTTPGATVIATVFGALGGVVAAITMDAAWFAREPAKSPPMTISAQPLVGQGRLGLSLGGSF